MKKIRYIVTDFMLGIGGGIYTFLQDHIRMTQSLGCDAKVIILGNESCRHAKHWDFDCEYIMSGDKFDNYKVNSMVVSALHKDAIIYCHSFEALRACVEANRPCYNQHHYGDLIAPEFKEHMDINHMYHLPQWRQMMALPMVTNIAQSPGIKHQGETIIGGNHVVAYEPFELPEVCNSVIDAATESDVIIVSGAYKRKQIPEMLNALEGSGLKVIVFSTDDIRVPYNLDCKVMVCQPREVVIAHMMKSKLLLHMSLIEIMPYAILEASQFIPSIVSDVPYTQDFLLPSIKSDINNSNLVQLIKDTIDSEYTTFDIETYRKDTTTHWKDLWKL